MDAKIRGSTFIKFADVKNTNAGPARPVRWVIPPKTITSVNPRAVVVYPCRVPALFTLLLTDGYVKIKGIDQKNQNLIAGPYTESCSVTGSILILPLTDAHYFREGASLFRRWHYDGQHA